MRNKLTTRQMINIELAERAHNTKVANMLQHHVPKQEQKDLAIAFNCECSDPHCEERIMLTLDEYQELHQKHSHFFVVKGHEEPIVEAVTKDKDEVLVVDKYAL